ncbi:hypothetical protein, partial [uncultured Ruegeria sp.]|uniref:hypothetical protein n=1 Tax=uncultured Ruegeria sp. TaxID=259304 RepID=UPI002608C4BC
DAHRLSDASQPSLRPVSSTSPAPVKGVLGLTQQTRKQKIQEIREKSHFPHILLFFNILLYVTGDK